MMASKSSPARGTAADAWAASLAAWSIPEEILAAAPESPWSFPPHLFAAPADAVDTPSRRRALEALPVAGRVLDVGCGGGAAALALVPPATHVTGVDSSPAMLKGFASASQNRGVDHPQVEGRWPDQAQGVDPAAVGLC